MHACARAKKIDKEVDVDAISEDERSDQERPRGSAMNHRSQKDGMGICVCECVGKCCR